MLRNIVFLCIYVGFLHIHGHQNTNRRSLFWFLMLGPCVAACRQWGFVLCLQLRQRAEQRMRLFLLAETNTAVTVFDKVLVISGAEWGSLVEEGEDRWGQVSCSRDSGVSPSAHLPSASSSQICIAKFLILSGYNIHWWRLLHWEADPKNCWTSEAPSNIIRLLKAFKTCSKWSQLEPAWTVAWSFYGQITRTWVGPPLLTVWSLIYV